MKYKIDDMKSKIGTIENMWQDIKFLRARFSDMEEHLEEHENQISELQKQIVVGK